MRPDDSPAVPDSTTEPRVTGVRATEQMLPHLRRAREHLDRHYADSLDLTQLAALARVSRFHFHRLFSATYGKTPAAYLTQRRIERAQDLLRATNLTVTEVCTAVGYSSLGSFSSTFTRIVGESPREFHRRWARTGAPRIPGCWVFMWGLAEKEQERKMGEAPEA